MTVPTLSTAERDRRWELARVFMEREGLDALLVFGEHEDAGPAQVAYDTWFTNGRPGTTVVFPRTGDPLCLFPGPLFIADHLESSRRDDMWFPPGNLRGFRHSAAIAETLGGLGLAKGKIGVVGLGPHLPWHPEGILPFRLWDTVLSRFPEAEFTPVDVAFAQLVSRLSPEELDLVRHSAAIGDAMVRAMVETAAPGVSESEVYAAGMYEGYRRGTLPAAMHFWSGPDQVASGLPEWGYRPKAPRVLREGDVIYAEVFCAFGGRHTQHQVTIAVGDVHEDFHRAGDVARAAYDAGLEALRPGRTFGELVDAVHKPILAADGSVYSIAVHSLNPGLALGAIRTDVGELPGAEDYPSVPEGGTLFADMVLQPGMTFVLEPNYAFGRRMVHLGGTVVVGEDLPVQLNPYTARILRATGTPAPGHRRSVA
ncbi:aminopeptidase P family protein [Nonomuraea sp. KC401]|uniref:M24 family metallopeptidase n=1 Tax=unclassified Nonomuraea TaxID=2593643 RepID=UPI0010FD3EF9|nr:MULTISPECIES: M24 family metallopeptidase [unclassified Nonomuraea]NBE93074.1 M24 family metallopeptidase [Nonomuraea sp. K271]TLF80366.1 aminopeptidase P family protein [Nonomuraea sp. KC401]